jgi:hypothetical protein
MFTKRQQCLIDLSSQKFTPDLEDRIKELEKVDIRFRKREEFQQLLDRHLSSEQDYMDYSHFQEFKVDFQNIALGLQQNNEYLQLVAQQTAQDKKERRKMKKKIEEIEQRLNLQDEGFRKHEVEIQDFCVEVDKCLKQTVSVEKMIRVESKKIKEITRVSAEGIKNEKRMMERMVQEKCQDLNAKIALVQQNENSFRERVQKIMDDIEQERVRREENEKKRAEEIAKKIAEDLEREAKLKEEEELKKGHPEKSRKYKGKVDAMNLNQKIEYLFDPCLKGIGYSNINHSKQYVKELLISNDGKYLFICEVHLDCTFNQIVGENKVNSQQRE